MAFEYRVTAAPTRGEKSKDAKTPTDRFTLALTDELNRMARDGWEYLRADVLPSEERSGLTGRATVYHNILVFRRLLNAQESRTDGRIPQPEYPAVASPAQAPVASPEAPAAAAPKPSDRSDGTRATPEVFSTVDAQPPAPRLTRRTD